MRISIILGISLMALSAHGDLASFEMAHGIEDYNNPKVKDYLIRSGTKVPSSLVIYLNEDKKCSANNLNKDLQKARQDLHNGECGKGLWGEGIRGRKTRPSNQVNAYTLKQDSEPISVPQDAIILVSNSKHGAIVCDVKGPLTIVTKKNLIGQGIGLKCVPTKD